MKKVFSTALYIAAAMLLAGCAKTETPGPNEANKRYFDAWMHINHPGLEATGLGIYVLDEKEGTGTSVTDTIVFSVEALSAEMNVNATGPALALAYLFVRRS